MTRLLLRLWWLRKRRNFNKRDLFVAIYIFSVYIVVCIGFYYGVTKTGATLKQLEAPAFAGYILAIVMLIPDIIMKMTMKQDATFMDDYLKTKPIPKRLWSKFILTTNVLNFFNYMIPLMLLPLLILLTGVGQSLLCFVVMILLSYSNSLFVTCFRRTGDRFLRFSLIAGWFLMLAAASLSVTVLAFTTTVLLNIGMAAFAVALLAGLIAFLANEEDYDEDRHKAARLLSFGKVNLFTMQFYGVIRAKRLRNMVLLMSVIFIADAYMMLGIGNEDGSLTVYGILAVVMPSLVMSQWTFGVEANFFQGLMTKPVSVKNLLMNSYYFYIILSGISAVFMIPMAVISDEFPPLLLVTSLAIAVFINLFNIPTCLFSTRLEIFGSSFFNMQGNNLKINLYSIALLIPLAILGGVWYLCSETVLEAVGIALGVISLAVHRQVINYVARVFDDRKYARLETFSS